MLIFAYLNFEIDFDCFEKHYKRNFGIIVESEFAIKTGMFYFK